MIAKVVDELAGGGLGVDDSDRSLNARKMIIRYPLPVGVGSGCSRDRDAMDGVLSRALEGPAHDRGITGCRGGATRRPLEEFCFYQGLESLPGYQRRDRVRASPICRGLIANLPGRQGHHTVILTAEGAVVNTRGGNCRAEPSDVAVDAGPGPGYCTGANDLLAV